MTSPDEVISRLRDEDAELKTANLNNVVLSEHQFLELFDALRHNDSLNELSMSKHSPRGLCRRQPGMLS
ncbi:Uncharacterized protein FKW44_022901 [Caligus rogercresseyi]|uniref:Uncharacterized protein n=1 Tax=Caligus rogercresseyi TaxID=217165 RepID=A0A7T8GNQ9_CALRO|nr:Uncharacterized protein FKW44_022901 [Caligus rogercresseyi]